MKDNIVMKVSLEVIIFMVLDYFKAFNYLTAMSVLFITSLFLSTRT
jgi:hypothetical protein